MYGKKYSLTANLLLENAASNALGMYCEYYVVNELRKLASLSANRAFVTLEKGYKKTATKKAYTKDQAEFEAKQQLKGARAAIRALGKTERDIKDVIQMGNSANRSGYDLIAQEDVRVQFKDNSYAIFTNKAATSDAGQANKSAKSVGLEDALNLKPLSNGLRTTLRNNLKGTLDLTDKVYDKIIQEGKDWTGETTETKVLAKLFPDKPGVAASESFPSSRDKNFPTLASLSSQITTWLGVTGAEALKSGMGDLSSDAVLNILVGGALNTYYPSVANAVQKASSDENKRKALKDGLAAINSYFLLDINGRAELVSANAHKMLIKSYSEIADGTAKITVGSNATNNVYICNGPSLLLTIALRKSSSRKIGLDRCDLKASKTARLPRGYEAITLGTGSTDTDALADSIEDKVDLAAESDASKDEAKKVSDNMAAALKRIIDLESGNTGRSSLVSRGALKLAKFYQGKGKTANIPVRAHVQALYEEILGIGLKAKAADRITANLVAEGYMDYLSPKIGNIKLSRAKHGFKPGTSPLEPRTLNDFIQKVQQIYATLNEAKNDSESIIDERWARLAGLIK